MGLYVVGATEQNFNHGADAGSGIANLLGQQVVMDFYTHSVLAGKGFQVRAGTITTPLVGDVLITDTAAEMGSKAAAGYTIIPVYANINFNLAAATLYEVAAKSVIDTTLSGTAFVPLPLRTLGPNGEATPTAAATTAAVAAAGGVTVAAELATTTRRHFAWGHPIAAGAWPTIYDWTPRTPPVLAGPAVFYVQIAADTTGPSYYASYDFLEFTTAEIAV
jgi:hypothetical protein